MSPGGGGRLELWEYLEMILDINERKDRLAADCSSRGAHSPESDAQGGWVVCEHCGIPLERPGRWPSRASRRRSARSSP